MKITGTEKIRKVLDIPSLKMQISKDQSFNIQEDSVWNTDVQTAINLGYIVTDTNKNTDILTETPTNKIKFKNVSTKDIVLSGLLINLGKTYKDAFVESPGKKSKTNKNVMSSVTVVAGGCFFINPEDLNNSDLQGAISSGLITQETFIEDEHNDQPLENEEAFSEPTDISNPDKLDFNDELIIKNITKKDKDDPRVATVIADPNQTRNDTKTIDGAVVWDKNAIVVDSEKKHPTLTRKTSRAKKPPVEGRK